MLESRYSWQIFVMQWIPPKAAPERARIEAGAPVVIEMEHNLGCQRNGTIGKIKEY